MADLPLHLAYRREIENQQSALPQLPPPLSQKRDFTLHDLINITGYRMGVSSILPEYLFKSHQIPESHDRVIILVTPMNYQAMNTAPSLDSATEILRSYKNAGEAVIDITKIIRSNGYDAMPHHPMGNANEYHHLLLPPHAVKAGLGERGRTGLFIDYEYGPTVRLAAVTTDAPLTVTESRTRGITEFCHRCKYCVEYCPPRALPDGTYLEQVQSGQIMDFKINAHRCFQYFKEHRGCGRCISNCILAENDRDKIQQRISRIEKWYQKWVVSGKIDEMYQSSGLG